MLFVRRARATFRRAELGFFGVCVYTRMQTPRFSGHPCRAGDFVFARICSRPDRTNCANVGTALPHELDFTSLSASRNSAMRRVAELIPRKGTAAFPFRSTQ